MTSLSKAAAKLQKVLPVPIGAANTLAYSGPGGPYLRVYIDPAFLTFKHSIPKVFEGFPVVIEQRQRVVAFH